MKNHITDRGNLAFLAIILKTIIDGEKYYQKLILTCQDLLIWQKLSVDDLSL